VIEQCSPAVGGICDTAIESPKHNTALYKADNAYFLIRIAS